MIRNYIIFIFLLFPTLLFAQKAKIAFDSKEHNFGRIQEKGGKYPLNLPLKTKEILLLSFVTWKPVADAPFPNGTNVPYRPEVPDRLP